MLKNLRFLLSPREICYTICYSSFKTQNYRLASTIKQFCDRMNDESGTRTHSWHFFQENSIHSELRAEKKGAVEMEIFAAFLFFISNKQRGRSHYLNLA